MTEAILTLPPHLRKRLADAVDSGLISAPYSVTSIRSVLGVQEIGDELTSALTSLSKMGLTDRAIAAWIRTVDEASTRSVKPDLIWSGPEMPGIHSRDTRRVYEELLGSVSDNIWVSTYAFFDGPKAFEALAKRLDALPELRVTVLLNIQRRKGDTSKPDEVVRKFTDRFWKTDWPGDRRPRVFYDPRSLELDGPAGVLHAKCVVADEEAVFITSANLTEAALDRNIELGLLVRDRALAASVSSHFRALIERSILSPLPMA